MLLCILVRNYALLRIMMHYAVSRIDANKNATQQHYHVANVLWVFMDIVLGMRERFAIG